MTALTGSLWTCTFATEEASPGLLATGGVLPSVQNRCIIIAGRPTCARRAKVIGAPISAVMVSAISARRWS